MSSAWRAGLGTHRDVPNDGRSGRLVAQLLAAPRDEEASAAFVIALRTFGPARRILRRPIMLA